ncbi:MAG: hypothetical protein AAF494_13230 [Pseudomonadota bacterium]
MNACTRRSTLSGLAIGMALLGLASKTHAMQGLQVTANKVRLPTAPMQLERLLQRDLRGAAKITVRRIWQVEFARQGQGIAITGQQLSAKVIAPAALNALAQIEETRDTSAMFPILLSDTGTLLAAGAGTIQSDINRAVQEAETMIARRPIPVSERDQHRAYLAQLQRTGSNLLEQLPPDLFFPASAPLSSVRTVNLPGGLVGEFELNYEAQAAVGHAWLDHAERRVITRIGDQERHSFERWSLRQL